MAFGGSRRRQRAVAAGVTAVVGLLLPLTACSGDLDRVRGLHTELAGVTGVSEADVTPATAGGAARISVVLDRDLDPEETLRSVRAVVAAAHDAGLGDHVLELRRSLVEDDVLVLHGSFAGSRRAPAVTGAWIRLVDAMLGEVTWSSQPRHDVIEVDAGGGIGHDVSEVSRIGYGGPATTWRIRNDVSRFVVSGRLRPRDVDLFDRVQRTVTSGVLPVPADRWELQRRTGHLRLDLEVSLGGVPPEQVTVEGWEGEVAPLARAAVRAARSPGVPRWVQLSQLPGSDERDVFAAWSSEGRPMRGRDPHHRGWDAWWSRLSASDQSTGRAT